MVLGYAAQSFCAADACDVCQPGVDGTYQALRTNGEPFKEEFYIIDCRLGYLYVHLFRITARALACRRGVGVTRGPKWTQE